MKHIILIVSLMFCLVGLPAHAQEGTKTYTGQGITLHYPESWFLFEKENGVGLSNVALEDEPDVAKVSPGLVTVRVLLLDTFDNVKSAETDPNFLLGYYTATYAQGYFWPEAFKAQFSGVETEGLELLIDIGEAENPFGGEKSALMVRQTVSLVDSAEFFVILIEDSIVVAASAPAGELEQWRETIVDLADSIEMAGVSG